MRERHSIFNDSRKSKKEKEQIFKHLSSAGATDITIKVVKESIKRLITKSKVVTRNTKQSFDFFFIADCQLEPEIEIPCILFTKKHT